MTIEKRQGSFLVSSFDNGKVKRDGEIAGVSAERPPLRSTVSEGGNLSLGVTQSTEQLAIHSAIEKRLERRKAKDLKSKIEGFLAGDDDDASIRSDSSTSSLSPRGGPTKSDGEILRSWDFGKAKREGEALRNSRERPPLRSALGERRSLSVRIPREPEHSAFHSAIEKRIERKKSREVKSNREASRDPEHDDNSFRSVSSSSSWIQPAGPMKSDGALHDQTSFRSERIVSSPTSEISCPTSPANDGRCGWCSACGSMPPWSPELPKDIRKDPPPVQEKKKPEGNLSQVRLLDSPTPPSTEPVPNTDFNIHDIKNMNTKDFMAQLSRRQSRRVEVSRLLHSHEDEVYLERGVTKVDALSLHSSSNAFLVSLDDDDATFYCHRCVRKIERIRELETEVQAIKSAMEARKARESQLEAKVTRNHRGRNREVIAKLQSELDGLQLTVNFLHSKLSSMERSRKR